MLATSCGNGGNNEPSSTEAPPPSPPPPPPPETLLEANQVQLRADVYNAVKNSSLAIKEKNTLLKSLEALAKSDPEPSDKRNTAIGNSVKDATLKADIITAMDKAYPAGGVLNTKDESGLEQEVYDAIIANPGNLSKTKLNAIMDGVKAAIAANAAPNKARTDAIKKAVNDNGGDDAFATAVNAAVDTKHDGVTLVAQGAMPDAVWNVIIGVNTSITNQNNLHAAVTALALKATENERNTDIDTAVDAINPALAAADATALKTALKDAVRNGYPITKLAKADAGIMGSVYDALAALNIVDGNLFNAAVDAVKNNDKQIVKDTRYTAIRAALAAAGINDATAQAPVLNAVDAAYFSGDYKTFMDSNLPLAVYEAITTLPGANIDMKRALLGVGVAHPILDALNLRPRAKATRDATIQGHVNGLPAPATAEQKTQWTNALTQAAEIAEPADGANTLPALAAANLENNQPLYDAVFGNSAAVPPQVPPFQNSQMLTMSRGLKDGVIDLRPRADDTRTAAIEALVRGVLGLAAGADLAAGTDARNWVTAIKGAVDAMQPTTALTAKADEMPQGVYDAVIKGKATSNADMNAILADLAANIFVDGDVANRNNKSARDTYVNNLSVAPVGGVAAVAGSLDPVHGNEIKAALDAVFGTGDLIAQPADVADVFFGEIRDDYAEYGLKTEAKNSLLTAINAALAKATVDEKVADINAAVDALAIEDDDRNTLRRLAVFAHLGTEPADSSSYRVASKVGDGSFTLTRYAVTYILPADKVNGFPLSVGDSVWIKDTDAVKDPATWSTGWVSTTGRIEGEGIQAFKTLAP